MSDTGVSHFRAKHAKVDHAAEVVSYHAKSIMAFLALLVTNMAAEVASTGQPWPSDTAGWMTLLGTTIGGTLLVWAKSNGPRPHELVVAPHSHDDDGGDEGGDKPPHHPPLPTEG